jgi:U2-associated protein SR140
MFDSLNKTWSQIDGRMKSESFKQKVLNCIRAWEDRLIYQNDFLVNLQNRFLGLVKAKPELTSSKGKFEAVSDEDDNDKSNKDDTESDVDDVDGKPLDDENDDDDSIDGKPCRHNLMEKIIF